MKEFLYFIILIITSSTNVEYAAIFSNNSFNDNYYPVINPINGTDYWKSNSICCEESVEWIAELKEDM